MLSKISWQGVKPGSEIVGLEQCQEQKTEAGIWNPETDMASLEVFPRNPEVEENSVLLFISYPTGNYQESVTLINVLESNGDFLNNKKKKERKNHLAKAKVIQLGRFPKPPDRMGLV